MLTQRGTAQRFSTASLPEDKRVELWEGHNESELINLRCRTLNGSALEASMVNLQLDHIHLARVTGNAHVVERTAELVRHRPSDAVAVYLTLVGEAFFYHEDAVRMVRPGQLLLCDTDRPFMRGFSQGLEELAVKVPRETFRELTGLSTLETPVVMDFARGSVEARTLAQVVGRAVRATDALPVEEGTVLQLLAQLVTRTPSDVAAVHLATAKALIEEHLGDQNLNALRVADGIGISERHLSRVFSASGSSLPHYVLSRRLDRAHAMIASHPELGIAELAARNGFGSATYFSHAFRDRFGERATDTRRRARMSVTPG